ncbi:MAG: ATP-binding protein [Lachnospiraceae bacterium]|nr:ATP-binding protein [Lachnospiraceae bacterium]
MSLTNMQYDELMRRYQDKHQRRARILNEREKKIRKEIPKIKEIDDKIAEISIKTAKAKLNKEDALSPEELEKKIASYHEEKEKLLEENGYSKDYLEPPYECPDCKDTGYIDNKRCHCFRQYAIDIVYRQANLSDILDRENFDAFDLSYYSEDERDGSLDLTARENAKSILRHTKEFCDNFKEENDNLLIMGNTGVGKTFLTHCIANELLSRGISVIYFTATDFFNILEKNVFQHDPEVLPDFDNIYSCDLLIIDDLGTEVRNTFTDSYLFQCLNERLLRKKSTVISTNLSTGDIASQYSERTYSRVYGNFKIIKLFGSDIRILKRIGE